MIKGVSKNVIEISDTGSDCFERAILFVRDNPSGGGDNLPVRAKEYLAGLKLRRRFYRSTRGPMAAAALLSALLGGLVTAAAFLLF